MPRRLGVVERHGQPGLCWPITNLVDPPKRQSGSATLHLDAEPVRAGSWLSGVVEVPERLHGSDFRLHVDCVHTFYSLSRNATFRWFAIAFLDGTKLERRDGKAFIPFAVELPEGAPPTSHDTLAKQRVDWSLRLQAIRPGAGYKALFDETFGIEVLPPDPAEPAVRSAPETPPRAMPELAPEEVAQRLVATVERAGDATVIRFPFPSGAATTAIVSAVVFLINGLAYFAPGLLPIFPSESELPMALAVVSGGFLAVMVLILLSTARAIEIGPETVRIPRGLFGIGFHTGVATRNVAAVVENPFMTPPNALPKFYSVALKLKDGTLYNAATRMRDPANARALADLLRSLLPKG